jgi:hypothetical protein
MEKFIVKVLRKKLIAPSSESTSQAVREECDQIFEQEFDKFDIGKFAVDLNRKDGQEKDKESVKL